MNTVQPHGTVRPLGPLTAYWGVSDLPAVAPIRLQGRFAELRFRGRYVGLCWR